jgi:MFS family permease
VAPTLAVLTRNRDFRYLFLAELVVFGGDWFALIPLITLLQVRTGSGLPGAIAMAADTMLGAFTLLFAGTLADRLDRRRLLIISNLASLAAISLLFLLAVPSLVWIGPVAIGLAAVGKAFYSPAAGAALPNVVDVGDLPAANALGGSAWGTMLVVGASLGGLVNAWFGPYVCFAIDVVCLAAAAWLVWRVRRPMQEPREAPLEPARPLRAIVEALRYIMAHPRVLSLVTVKSAVGFGNGVLAVFPILASVGFGLSSIATGLLFAARGLGALIGPLLFRRVLSHRSWLMPGLAISMAAYGIAYIGVSLSPWFWLVLALVVIAHVAGGGNWVMSNYGLQIEVPDDLRGRVMATDMMIATLAISVSLLGVGAIVDLVDPRLPLAICGAATLTYGIVWRLATRRLMRSPARPTAPALEPR